MNNGLQHRINIVISFIVLLLFSLRISSALFYQYGLKIINIHFKRGMKKFHVSLQETAGMILKEPLGFSVSSLKLKCT